MLDHAAPMPTESPDAPWLSHFGYTSDEFSTDNDLQHGVESRELAEYWYALDEAGAVFRLDACVCSRLTMV